MTHSSRFSFFKDICSIGADDGVNFDAESIVVDTVRDESGYSGLRLKCYATIDGARVRIVIDIGYGDATEPGLNEMEFQPLLDQPAPKLRAYPPETVIAEKFQAMVHLGLANTRVKDFYDIGFSPETASLKAIGLPARSRRPSIAARLKFPPSVPTLSLQPMPTIRRRFSNGPRLSRMLQ